MHEKCTHMKFLASSIGVFVYNSLPFSLRICSSLHSRSSLQKAYITSKSLKRNHKELHCFKNLYPWKTLSDFSNHLKSSIVYNEGGLIALNKPYGVGIYRCNKRDDGSTGAVNLASHEDFSYTIEDCLQDLKCYLNVSDLTILKSCERYASGIVLLSINEVVSARVRKSQSIARGKKIPPYIYWALSNGDSLYPALKQNVGIKLIALKSKNEKQPVIVKSFSKREIRKKKVKPVVVEHRTIAVNKETSTAILEIATSSAKWHFVRVYASSQVSGIMGDTIYGLRMRRLLGQPISMNIENITAYDVKPLSEPLCHRLDLPCTVEGHLLVPIMLHLRSIVLPQYIDNKDVIINASAPPHFTWTCSKLDFILPLSLIHI